MGRPQDRNSRECGQDALSLRQNEVHPHKKDFVLFCQDYACMRSATFFLPPCFFLPPAPAVCLSVLSVLFCLFCSVCSVLSVLSFVSDNNYALLARLDGIRVLLQVVRSGSIPDAEQTFQISISLIFGMEAHEPFRLKPQPIVPFSPLSSFSAL